MALQSLYRITFKNSSNAGFVSGDKVITYWDDVAQTIVAYKNGSLLSSGVSLGSSSTRPPRGSTVINYVVTNEPIDSPAYQFCSGTTLVTFSFLATFPYSKRFDYPNSASCITGIVCDLAFIGSPTTVAPTSESATDGQISVTAAGSNGAPRYSLEDELYSEMTNTTGVFTNLIEGAYIVYARDQYNCSKSISVLLEATDKYGTLYSYGYLDLAGVETLVEIQMINHLGTSTDIVGSDLPLTLSLRGENQDLFTTILSSNASIGLTSRVNFEFLDLFTQDDRKYLTRFYKKQQSTKILDTAQVTALTQIVNGGAAAWGSPYCIITLGGGTTGYGYTKLLPINQNRPFTLRVFWEHDVTVGSITASSFDIIMLRHDYSVIGSPITVDTGTGTTSGSPTYNLNPSGYTVAYIGFKASASSTFSAVSRLLLDSLEVTVSHIEKWRGFIKPSLYTEQYVTATNYYVTAEATDQLENLKDIQFLDKNGNTISGELSLIKIIALILSFTDLDLGIRSYTNAFEVDMDTTSADDPLLQTYIDSATYVDSDEALTCYEVLNNILLSFGCRILQWEGYWHIIPIDGYSSSMPYREFDAAGNYVTNGTFNASVSLDIPTKENRACWANSNQSLEVRGAFGKSTVILDLKKVDFGVKNGGFESFSSETLVATGTRGSTIIRTRITSYDNWTLNVNGNGASLPLLFNAFPNRGSDGIIGNDKERKNKYSGCILSVSNNTVYGQDAYLQSTPQKIIFGESDWIRFSFDFYAGSANNASVVESSTEPPFVKFKFSFKLENYYLRADGGWTTDSNFQWIEVNVDRGSYGSWKTIEAKAQCPPVSGDVTSTYTVKLMHGSSSGNAWDFTSSSDLQSLATVNLQVGAIAFVVVSAGVDALTYRWYRLETSTATTSDPDRLRPTDYNGTTNKVVWIKFEEYTVRGAGQRSIKVRNFDNVTVEVLPQGDASPVEIVEEELNDSKIKENYEVTVINGDAPYDILNARNIYYNHYRYSDGTPTISWNRSGVTEGYSLLGLLAKRIIEQHSKPMFKLTGDMTSDVFFGFNAFFNEESTGKKYIPMAISIDDKKRMITAELQEVLILTSTGAENIGEFDATEFDNSFDI